MRVREGVQGPAARKRRGHGRRRGLRRNATVIKRCTTKKTHAVLTAPRRPRQAATLSAAASGAAASGVRALTVHGMPLAVWMVAPVAMPTFSLGTASEKS